MSDHTYLVDLNRKPYRERFVDDGVRYRTPFFAKRNYTMPNKPFTLPADAATRPATPAMRVFLARLEKKDNRPEGALTMLAVAERIAKAKGEPLPQISAPKAKKEFVLPADADTRPASPKMRAFLARMEHKTNFGEDISMAQAAARIKAALEGRYPAAAAAAAAAGV